MPPKKVKANGGNGNSKNNKQIVLYRPPKSNGQGKSKQGPGVGVTRTAPVSKFQELRSFFQIKPGSMKDSIRIHGQDYLSQTTMSAGSPAGTPVTNILISPGAGLLSNTRLGNFAQLYDKYLFRNLKFYCQSSSPTSNAGSYLLAYDRDVSDPTPPSNQDAIRSYFGHAGTRTASVWDSLCIECPLSDKQEFYYTSPNSADERTSYQGQLYLAVVSPCTASATMSLWVEYDIELFDPQLELQLVEAKQQGTSGTTSSASGAGWNTAITATAANLIVPSIINPVTGNRGFYLNPGTWMIETYLQQSSAAGNVIAATMAIDAVTGLDVTGSVMSAVDTAYATLPAIANAVAARVEKALVLGPNPVFVYGNLGSTGGTVSNIAVRVLEMFGLNLA